MFRLPKKKKKSHLNRNIQSSYRGTQVTLACRDSERTVTLPVYCQRRLELIWKTARLPAWGGSHNGAISINSSYFVFPASRGISMVTLYAVKQEKKKSLLGLTQATCCSRRVPAVQLGERTASE